MIKLPKWLEAESATLDALIAKRQFPHALLIHGAEGTGRRLLALWLVGRLLDLREIDLRPGMVVANAIEPDSMPQHPDFQFLQPEADKRSISIDRVRELIAFLSLTSHQAGAKVALITPAHAMTRPAANSLLKTLEEPPGNSCIILVAAALSRLPATIVSRCRRVRVAAPPFEEANAWLTRQASDVDWGPILELAGGAPLSALRLQQSDFSAHAVGLNDDISALLKRRLTPAGVARRWKDVDPDLCLQWLYRRISQEIRLASGIPAGDLQQFAGLGYLQNPGESLNIEASFADLQEISELRRLQGAGLNQDLQLAQILGRWYGGARL